MYWLYNVTNVLEACSVRFGLRPRSYQGVLQHAERTLHRGPHTWQWGRVLATHRPVACTGPLFARPPLACHWKGGGKGGLRVSPQTAAISKAMQDLHNRATFPASSQCAPGLSGQSTIQSYTVIATETITEEHKDSFLGHWLKIFCQKIDRLYHFLPQESKESNIHAIILFYEKKAKTKKHRNSENAYKVYSNTAQKRNKKRQ